MNQGTVDHLTSLMFSNAGEIINKHAKDGYQFTLEHGEISEVFRLYETLKRGLKDSIDFNDEEYADRHKVAAVFFFSTLETSPIGVEAHPSDFTKKEAERFPNRILGMSVAQYIVFVLLKAKLGGADTTGKKPEEFEFPLSGTGQNPYVLQLLGLVTTIRESLHTDNLGKLATSKQLTAAILSLSHIFFLLEAYTLKH